MSVVLDLKPEVEAALAVRASDKGLSVSSYVSEMLSRQVDLDIRLAPVRKAFEESGMTEDELDEFMNGVRKKAFEERYPNGRP